VTIQPNTRRARARWAAVAAVVLVPLTLLVGAPAASAQPGTNDPLAVAADAALDALAQVRAARANPAFAEAFPETNQELARIVSAWVLARANVVILAADRAGVDPMALGASWLRSGEERTEVVLTAIAQVGVRYRWARSVPGSGFDCSGLTAYAWSVRGVGLAHSSRDQIGAARPVSLASAQPGDLAYFTGHVMLYLGVGTAVVHAPNTGRRVEVRQWYAKKSVRLGDPS